MMRYALLLFVVASTLSAAEPLGGIYEAAVVPGSPKMTASALVWWKDKLIVADRGNKRLLAFTPPDKFETFVEIDSPFGIAVDINGDLIVTEKVVADKSVTNRLLRVKPDGTKETIITEDVGSPHFVAVHPKGTICWSGFPDGGTRSLKPGGKVTIHTPRIGHTYGICFTPQHDCLLVSSKLPNADRRSVYRFPVDKDGTIGEGAEFFKTQDLLPMIDKLPVAKDGSRNLVGWLGRLQGMTVDAAGNIYIAGAESHTAGEAIAAITPDGKSVKAMILGVPRNVTCMAFGGKDGRTLYITGSGEYPLYAATLP